MQGMQGPASVRSTTDGATAQEKARKLEKALEVVSDVDGPAAEALRAEGPERSFGPTLDVQIQQCESFIIRSERRLAEIDAQRVAEQESLTEARARLERLRSEAAQCADRQESGSQVASLQQMVNLLHSERDALAKELQVMCATEEDVRSVAKKQAVARLAISHREVQGAMPNDVMSWLQDRQAEQHDALMMGDLPSRHGVGPSDVGRREASGRNYLSAAIFCGQHGHVKTSPRVTHKDDVEIESPAQSFCDPFQKTPQPITRIVEHRCGMQGVRVGEASNPGPPRRLILRPVEEKEMQQFGTVIVSHGRGSGWGASASTSDGCKAFQEKGTFLKVRVKVHPLLQASSGAVAECLCEFRPPAVSVTEEPVHREFDMTLQDSDTESVGTPQPVDHERNSTQGNRRLQLQWSVRVSQTVHQEVRAVAELVDNLGRRIGSVPLEGRIPRLVTEMVAFQCAIVLGRAQFGTKFSCVGVDHGNHISHLQTH